MKRLLLIVGILLSLTPLYAQLTDAWLSMPDTVCPFLTQQQRFHLLQYANAGMTDTIVNRFEGKTYVDSVNLSASYLSVQMTANSRWVITTAASMIRIEKVVSAPLPSTTFYYYDHTWKLLRKEHEPFLIETTAADSLQHF